MLTQKYPTRGLSAVADGRIKCLIVDAKTKKTIKEYPWQKNLILNHCFDYSFKLTASLFNSFQEMLQSACVGDGTTPTQDDSGTTVAQQVGTDVTLSGGSFVFTNTATDAGKVIKWDSGEESTIVTVVSSTEVTVLESQSVSTGEFTVYRTNQTLLANELKRTDVKVAGANGRDDLAAHIVEYYRTFEFTAEVADVTYTEVGFRQVNGFNSLCSVRVLLATPLSLVAGQQLRLIHRMRWTWSPSTKLTDLDDLVVGWPQYPVASQMYEWGIENLSVATIQSNGSGTGNAYLEARQFRAYTQGYLTTSNAAVHTNPDPTVRNFNSVLVSGTTATKVVKPYVDNSFTMDADYIFTPAFGAYTNIRGFIYGYLGTLFVGSVARIRWYEEQSKLDTYRLTFPTRLKYGRVLS